tara:strand:+ start:53 stop:304 length:252 start_codon:yes stop_codon:yes gene_type:complete
VEKLLRLVELRAEILELLPYKANVYPYDPMTGEWGDGTKMGRVRRQIEELKKLGYNKNRRKALQQICREIVATYNDLKRKGKI